MTTEANDSSPDSTSHPPSQHQQTMPLTNPFVPSLPSLFTSLTRTPRWALLRTLNSSNPHDITGYLHGTASFVLLPPSSSSPTQSHESLYTESGSLPANLSPTHSPLQWKKSYIWRLTPTQISVWFVKPVASEPPEADYLFHGMEFRQPDDNTRAWEGGKEEGGEGYVSPPVPPPVRKRSLSGVGAEEETVVVMARGNHLCINDMYRTAYAFRVRVMDGEVVSWASRHVVKGPKKNQDIVNLYSVAEPGLKSD